MPRLSITLVLIVLYLFVSCSDQNKVIKNLELEKTVNRIKNLLPLNMFEGVTLIKVEYIDTLLSMQMEIDENVCPIDDWQKEKDNQKKIWLMNIANSKDDDRRTFEICVSNKIYINYHFKGKHSLKEFGYVMTPEEIGIALKNEMTPYQALVQQIELNQNALPEDWGNGMTLNTIELLDSMVVYIISMDEQSYKYNITKKFSDKFKSNLKKQIRNMTIANEVRIFADAHYGVIYRFIGNVSHKTYDVIVSPEEIAIEYEQYLQKIRYNLRTN